MQYRSPLKNGRFYHIYNKSIDRIKIFQSHRTATRFLGTLKYYQSANALQRFSTYLTLPFGDKIIAQKHLDDERSHHVNILCYCLMPNHYHLLLRQTKTNGILTFMSQSINSFTHFYNRLHDRKGTLFVQNFQYRMIEDDNDLIYVSKYIHLNPLSSSIIKKVDTLDSYKLSSYPYYIGSSKDDILLRNKSLFSYFNTDSLNYKKMFDQ